MSDLPREVRSAQFLLGLALGVGVTVCGMTDDSLEEFCNLSPDDVEAFLKDGKMPAKLKPYIYKPLKSLGSHE